MPQQEANARRLAIGPRDRLDRLFMTPLDNLVVVAALPVIKNLAPHSPARLDRQRYTLTSPTSC